MKDWIVAPGLALLCACATGGSGSGIHSAPAPMSSPVAVSHADAQPVPLTHDEATIRAKQITHVTYELWFGLDATHHDYEGRTVVHFDLKPKARDHSNRIFLDFTGGTVRSLTLNGVTLTDVAEPSRYDGNRIYFKVSDLTAGTNRVEIAFSHDYSRFGNGFYRFQDPTDSQVYLYTNFEPYRAHLMFPCFDQPDLKASYELTVEAPDNWQVISNTMERDVNGVDGRKSWQFPPSPVFSTYLFALHAGPYSLWKGDAEGIPTRLFARKSIAEHVEAKEWLDITKEGLDYYSVLFGYPYPYSKYDQIIVPDFNEGAMENVGAVTFTENYVFRTKVTQDRHRDRADTILHEMAHMWFGDLVTMKWWNGLWLNESFATYQAAGSVDKAAHYPGSWQNFFAEEKDWAYWTDQLVVTHPIEVPVGDTDVAESNFDGITYGKGASVLKQLDYYLGDENFREGVQRYFERYALRNTTITDFFRMLTEASGQDLSHWQDLWLQIPGVNTVRAKWQCEDEKVSQFTLLQTAPPEFPKLRPHKTEVALFSKPHGHYEAKKKISVSYSDAETPVPDAIGQPCPAFVFPNHDDYDYVKVELDPVSLDVVGKELGRVEDPFVRQMLWHTLWEMVVDGKLAAQDFAETVMSQGPQEKDTLVLRSVLSELARTNADRDSVYKFLPTSLRADYFPKIDEFLYDHVRSAPGGTDLQLVWYNSFIGAATSQKSQEFIRKLLTGKNHLAGLTIDQEKRWDLVTALARNGAQDSADLIQAELKQDPGDMGRKRAITAEAQIPNQVFKAKWLAKVLAYADRSKAAQSPDPGAQPSGKSSPSSSDDDALPIGMLRKAMGVYQQIGQEDYSRAMVDVFFARLPALVKGTDEVYSEELSGALFPTLCEDAIVAKTRALLAAHPELPAHVVKNLKIEAQEEERCIRARAVATDRAAKKPG